MDFHTLTRRQLQALCKKNNIPANLTNLAMALALQALPTVQGVEELLLQQPLAPSTESPAKSQLSVPRTAGRGTATARRKSTVTVKEDESEATLHPSTRTRRSTRRLPLAADVPQTPLPLNNRTKAASACRKMENHFNEIEQEEHQEDHNNNSNNIGKEREHLSEIPAIAPASRQRSLKHTHSYSTRRSARLAERNMEDFVTSKEVKEGSKALTTELFSDEFEEIMEMNQQQQQECPAAGSLPVTESSSVAGVDLKEKSELGLLDSYKPEVLSGTKSGCSLENHNNFPIQCDEHGGETFEIGDSKMGVECDNGSNEIYCNKTEDAFKDGEELDINDEMGCNDVAAEDVAQVTDTNDVCTIGVVTGLKVKSEEELLEANKDFGSSDKTNAPFDDENGKNLNEAKEMESEDDAAQSLVDEGKELISDDLDALNINDGAVESNEPGELAVGITSAAQGSMVEISAFANDLAEKLVAMELDTCPRLEAAADVQVEPPCAAEEECRRSMSGYNVANLEITDEGTQEEELKNYEHATDDDDAPLSYSTTALLPTATGVDASALLPCITAESNENLSSVVVQTGSLTSTPMKEEESATPSKTTATQPKICVAKKTPRQVTMPAAHVSDDKENNFIIHNSGTKLIAAEEKGGKKQSCQENPEKPLDEQSLRQLTKMLKEKLEITKKMSMSKVSSKEQAAPTGSGTGRRLALQTLPENQLE